MITDFKQIDYHTKYHTKRRDNISTNTEIAEILDYISTKISELEKIINQRKEGKNELF